MGPYLALVKLMKAESKSGVTFLGCDMEFKAADNGSVNRSTKVL